MPSTTGWIDTFNRTVSNGFGTCETPAQAYSVNGTASQYSIAPGTASIAISGAGEKFGIVDLESSLNVDYSGQVAMGAIPTTNLATAGFIVKYNATTGNYYTGTMMVAAGGAISLRFSKVIGGGLTTIATVATGLTYVANTFYNLRFQVYWSRTLQTNVMSLKLWAIGATQLGGWQATTTDSALTDYTAGAFGGIYGRDESAVFGTITTKYKSVSSLSYNLPMPIGADTMCADPAFTFPKQTALETLADATDAAMATLDPLTSLAGLFPRARISNTNFSYVTSALPVLTYNATEFNVATNTNLGYDNTSLYLPVGIWLLTFEILLAENTSNYMIVGLFGTGAGNGSVDIDMRSNASQANDNGVGGTGHLSMTVVSTDPTTPIQAGASISPLAVTTYLIRYMALSAIKISDYFS